MSDSDSDEDLMYDDDFDSQYHSQDEDYFDSKLDDSSGHVATQILTIKEIVQLMLNLIHEVNAVIKVPDTLTRILLNRYKWDKQKLLDQFYSVENETFFSEAKIINPFIKKPSYPTKYTRSVKKQQTKMECNICFGSLESVLTGLDCGHRFCTDCWNEYLTTKIMDEGNVESIKCAAFNCEIIVDDLTIMKLVKDPRIKTKYQHFMTNNFVSCNSLMRWCITPNCNNVIRVDYSDFMPVTCSCGTTFCFLCSQNWHDPVQCTLLKKWTQRYSDDCETLQWLTKNTKDCPKCASPIEKNKGCNHMSCTKCKYEFCWICRTDWKTHKDNYKCNQWKQQAQSADASRLSVQRYLFYCERYLNHERSLELEKKFNELAQIKMEEMQKLNMSWIETQFILTAVEILRSCRQTLMYSYAFAFYLKKNNQVEIFTENQVDLEKATECLSEYLEFEIGKEELSKIKQKVQNKSLYCESRRKVLISHVHEGYNKDWWSYEDL